MSDIDFEDNMNLYLKVAAKPYSFLINNTTLESDNPLRFRRILLDRIQIVIMKIEEEVKNEKLQHDINR